MWYVDLAKKGKGDTLLTHFWETKIHFFPYMDIELRTLERNRQLKVLYGLAERRDG